MTATDPKPRRPFMRRAFSALVSGAGWVSFGAILVGLSIENHPRLEAWIAKAAVHRAQGSAFEALAQNLEIDDVDVQWLERTVVLNGVVMGPTGSEIRLGDLTCRLGFGLGTGVRIERLGVNGGEITVSEDLVAGFESGGLDAAAPDLANPAEVLAGIPDVVVRNLDLSMRLPSGSIEPVGRVDVSVAPEDPSGARIFGRLVPEFLVAKRPPGVIWLSGFIDEHGGVELDGIARALEIRTEREAAGEVMGRLTAFRPQARVDLTAKARFDLSQSILPTVFARLSVTDGSLILPWLPRFSVRPVRDVDLAMEIQFEPKVENPFDPDAWSARGSLTAEWEDLRGTSAFRMGGFAPEGSVLDAWVDLPGAPLGEQLGELAAGEPGVVEIEDMLAPRGSADVSIGVRLPKRGRGSEHDSSTIARSLERFLSIRPRGEAQLSYHGGIDRRTGRRDLGFPLPVSGVNGDVTWSIRPSATYQGQLAFYDVTGRHTGGPVDVQGSLHFVPRWLFADPKLAYLVPAPFHLTVETENLVVDDAFRRGMAGLEGVPETRQVLPMWNPNGGAIDFHLELWRTVDRQDMSLDLDAKVSGLSARWAELSVPVSNVEGSIRVQTNGGGPVRGAGLVILDLSTNTTAARKPVQIRGRISSDGRSRSLAWFDVQADELNPRSEDLRAELGRKNPAALSGLDGTGIADFVDAHVTAVRAIPWPESNELREIDRERFAYAGGMHTWLDVSPTAERSGLLLQPRQFSIATRNTHGRLRVVSVLPPKDPALLYAQTAGTEPPAALEESNGPAVPAVSMSGRVQGLWRQTGPSVPVVASFAAAGESPPRFVAYGAGLDISNNGLIGALIETARAAGSEDGGNYDPIDTDSVDLAGRVDFGASFTLPATPAGPLTDTQFDLEARLERLNIGGSQVLKDVSAHLTFVEASGQWIGEEVQAKLGRTPVRLEEVAWTPTENGSEFRTRITAKGLPIDDEHLSFFLDPATRRIVLEDLRARGTFDLDGAELLLRRGGAGEVSVEFGGELGVKDAFVDMGVPIELSLVESIDLHLAHEGRGLRANAGIRGAFGTIAGRRLENARLGLTYVEPRLVIEALEGGFEGGRLRAIGSGVSPGANLFTIDLAAPFPFELAAEMEDVDIGEFLRGVFDSDFANRGRMDMNMRLSGDFEHLTELRGGGRIDIKDSALWAIPAFQALSSRLGIDTTVLFRTMRCDYTIGQGELVMDRMRVDSDLLSLVGDGSMSFEGNVTSDLEVRYSLVDRLGPLTRLVYWIQNSLLRVSIRGTMERPTVVLRGLISQLFSPSEERDRLPLPGFSKRRRRF